jgi:radical SAM protein with 4Fe4S-binding SPASM domain
VDCPHIPELSYSDFGRRLRRWMGGRREPITGSMELTFRCNLRCVHCYVANGHGAVPGEEELSLAEIKDILDQLADAGCLWLLLTGGEPLVRPDFLDIYLAAKQRGFLIALFTNGTLLTPEVADVLAEYPPFKVEITLYGRTQETYERITGVSGSYARCMRGIELLLERDLRLKLKTMLMTLNKHELWDIQAFAEELGVDFRFDPMMNAAVDGSHDPLQYRLSPQEVVAFDQADPQRMEEWREFCDRFVGVRPDPRYRYTCGAGISTFHIDPYGRLSVCMIAREPEYDLRRGTFRQGWDEALLETRYQPAGDEYACNTCPLISLCGQCPGYAQLEHGDPERPVPFLCQVAHLRAKALGIAVGSQWKIGSRIRQSVVSP